MSKKYCQSWPIARREMLIASAELAASGCAARLPWQRAPTTSNLLDMVHRYANFGHQVTGGTADRATAAWLCDELEKMDVKPYQDRFQVKQLTAPSTELVVGSHAFAAFPQWRFPTPVSGLHLNGRLLASSEPDLRGCIALTTDPVPTSASWTKANDAPVLDAAQRGALALLIAPTSTNGGLFAYNRDAADPDFPIPVIIVRPGDLAALRARLGAEADLVTTSPSSLRETSNVIGILPSRAGDTRHLVISTPRSGWFRCGAERGSGIALWLALASFAARRLTCAATFVASTGHEIGHFGMKRFMASNAPDQNEVTLWIHLGASIAARRSGYTVPVESAQQVFLPQGKGDAFAEAFAKIGYSVTISGEAAPGETGEIAGKGYRPLIGFAGHHPTFHTPEDDGSAVDPEILEHVRACLQAILTAQMG